VCSAGSRLLIQETIFDLFIARLKRRMTTLRLGHCLDKVIDMGPLVDETQLRSVGAMVQTARDEGAEVFMTSLLVYLSVRSSACPEISFCSAALTEFIIERRICLSIKLKLSLNVRKTQGGWSGVSENVYDNCGLCYSVMSHGPP